MDYLGAKFGRHSQIRNALIAGIAVCCFGSSNAKASLILEVQSVSASAGSSGNAFDVDLANLGPSSVTVGGFAFGTSTAASAISFTDANTSTALSYIFALNSLFGPDLTGPTSGQSLTVSDIFAIQLSGVTLLSGDSVGLGHVLFSVTPNAAAGTYDVNLSPFPLTSLSDALGNDLTIDALSNGQITITGQVIPEPSFLLPLLAGLIVLFRTRPANLT